MKNNFCTCNDLACPLNPKNHDKGCSPCIQKNLRQKEIPNCFSNWPDLPEKGKAILLKNLPNLSSARTVHEFDCAD